MMSNYQELERHLTNMERISAQYDESSEEYKTLVLAGKAMLFAAEHQVLSAFNEYLKSCQNPLTEKQVEFLRDIGVPLNEGPG